MRSLSWRAVLTALLLLLAAAFGALWPANAAGQIPGLDQAGMQGMLQAAQQAQNCFAGVDQQAVHKLAEEGKALERDVQQLCRSGNWREAEARALAYAQSMARDPNLVAMRKCGELMAGKLEGMLPQLPYADLDGRASRERGHFCDDY